MKNTLFLLLTLTVSFLLALGVSKMVLVEDSFSLRPGVREEFATIPSQLASLLSRRVTPSIGQNQITAIPPAAAVGTVESLARCLRDKGFIMYGTENCSACILEKSYFGDNFRYISFVDCEQKKDLCQTKNIRSYPTWEDKNGVKYKGAIPLATLARLSGCPPPV